ncbi:glycerophosphodiester phosphodiesterase family protein [Vibrio maritimus]|uniref:glycerophosphodiester phosphodiesterase family protein n=1 Tax=Vibrio maritimus TaxID=990268 RepID=UPI0040697F7A
MNSYRLVFGLVATVSLAGCGDDNDNTIIPEEGVNVILEENFTNVENGQLPEGWDLVTNLGEAYVKDGYFYVDGTVDNYTATAVELPQELSGYGNYKVTVNFTIPEANNSSRWAGFKYRILGSDPYYQMAIRQAATNNNGTELAARYQNEWTILDTSAFNQDIDPEQIYTVEIITHGDRVQQKLNGQLLHDNAILPVMGNIGFQAAGSVLKIQDVKITEQTETLPKLEQIYSVNEPETEIAMAPSVIGTDFSSLDSLNHFSGSNAYLKLDSSLGVYSQNGAYLSTLEQLLAAELNIIPVLELANDVDLDKLREVVETYKSVDLTFVSTEPTQLTELRTKNGNIRSAMKVLAEDVGSDISAWHSLVSKVTASKSRIVLLPQSEVTAELMEYLQRRLLTVWVEHDGTSSMASLLTTGAHGLVTAYTDELAELMGKFPSNSLIRKPLIIGHRGVPSLVSENTLEGAIKALELGVDGNEYDVYLSADNHVVVMHDTTVDRTTDGTGKVEEMTLEELQALSILDLDGVTPTSMKIPTLAQFFEEFKGEDMTHFLEIKSSNPLIVDEIAKLTEEYDVADQLIVITFNEQQTQRMAEIMPTIPVGLLTSHSEGRDSEATLLQMLKKVQPLSTTYNPSYANLSEETIGIAKHRGMTLWPWTYRNKEDQNKHYTMGIHGLTTDYAQWSSDKMVSVSVSTSDINVDVDEQLALDVLLRDQKGGEQAAIAVNFLVTQSSADYDQNEDGELVFSTSGQAEVLAMYQHHLETGESYFIYSTPVTVTVN